MAAKKGLDEIAKALGVSRIIKLDGSYSGGPLEWLHLAQIVQSRLVSTGGRPSDPRWDTKRLVPFRRRVWKRLTRQARVMNVRGRKVGPAQLAAILIEERLGLTD